MDSVASPIIGIDLGTSTSEIAYLRDGRPELLQDEMGERIVPSVVQLTPEGEILVGVAARNGAATYADRTVQEVKRLMGDPDARITLGDRSFTPAEISSFILRHLVRAAEARLGAGTVQDVVITVPARFDNPAREATKKAAEMAGLRVLRLVNEPTAAATSYGLDKRDEDQTVLVFDFGGGTLDVTILQMLEGVFDVRTSIGDDRLGGKDIDALLVAHFHALFQERWGSPIPQSDRRAWQTLKMEAERYKRQLSFATHADVDIPYLSPQGGISLRLTRADFDRMIEPLVIRALALCEEALRRANLTFADVDVILPVGGSSRIPAFRRAIESRWGRSISEFENPDEAVARGAAIYAGIVREDATVADLVVLDNAPHRLGTSVLEQVGANQFLDDYFSEIIPKDAKLPAHGTRRYLTAVDSQRTAHIRLYEAVTDSNMCADHRLVGEMHLNNIPPAPAGQPFDIELRYDSNGMLEASARCTHAPEIAIEERFEVVGRGEGVLAGRSVTVSLSDLWSNSDAMRRAMPLLNRAEEMSRERPDVAERLRTASDALRDALIAENAAEIDRCYGALDELLFDLA